MTKELVKKYPLLGSSVDPKKLALTVKGILLAVVTILVSVSGIFGTTLDATDLNTLVGSIQNAIVAIASAVSAIMVVYGGVRKLVMKFEKK